MDALLHHTRAFVADVGAVVVVAKENQTAYEFGFAAHARVFPEHLDSAIVSFRTIWHARAITIFRNHDRLVRKGLMNLFQIASQIIWRSLVPALVIFIPLNEVH